MLLIQHGSNNECKLIYNCNCFQELSRKRLVSYALLSFLTLTSTNDAAYIEGHSPRNQTTLEIPITTTSDRDSTFPQKPEVLNTVTPKQDDKSPTAQRTSDDLQSSSSESRRTAKSPLVLRLLEEQESTDNSKQLVYFPLPQLQPGPEQKHLYYQQTFQENEASVSEHADVEEETFAHKATGVCADSCLSEVSRVIFTRLYGHRTKRVVIFLPLFDLRS
jgi:hypothetical protein